MYRNGKGKQDIKNLRKTYEITETPFKPFKKKTMTDINISQIDVSNETKVYYGSCSRTREEKKNSFLSNLPDIHQKEGIREANFETIESESSNEEEKEIKSISQNKAKKLGVTNTSVISRNSRKVHNIYQDSSNKSNSKNSERSEDSNSSSNTEEMGIDRHTVMRSGINN